jgi:NADH-quinone oxidoreductase subunit N
MLAGVVVSTATGVKATVFYLVVYLFMNLAAFAVVVARERQTARGDDITSLYGLGLEQPWLAWPMTIGMLGLAGFPATAGFFGKIYLIDAAVDNEYAWLGVLIVLGSAISLAYYLRVVAAIWMRPAAEPAPAMAGGSPEADVGAEASPTRPKGTRCLAIIAPAAMCAAATVFFGVIPSPLVDWANHAGGALAPFF